jgi:hypothetical protein
MSEDRSLQALRALAQNDLEQQAPPGVEARLLHEFRALHGRRRGVWPTVAAVAATILITVLITAFLVVNPAPNVKREAVPAVSTPAPQRFERAPVPQPVVNAALHKVARKPAPVSRPEPREVATDFFPLTSSALPFERGQMLRVQLPAAAMRTVGLPVREERMSDPVQADVLVGEEGIARAIRFVRVDVP